MRSQFNSSPIQQPITDKASLPGLRAGLSDVSEFLNRA